MTDERPTHQPTRVAFAPVLFRDEHHRVGGRRLIELHHTHRRSHLGVRLYLVSDNSDSADVLLLAAVDSGRDNHRHADA